jgi:hypothetical protein
MHCTWTDPSYRQFGFRRLKSPERWMEKHDPDVYAKKPVNTVP